VQTTKKAGRPMRENRSTAHSLQDAGVTRRRPDDVMRGRCGRGESSKMRDDRSHLSAAACRP
jgi:hypothetical protein